MRTSNQFSGSYRKGDVTFLLRRLSVADTPIELKERLIQSGKMHYSQLLTHEQLPAAEYLTFFYQAMASLQQRLAYDLSNLALQIAQAHTQKAIVLISLARAGTPFGVVLKHLLQKQFTKQVSHYSLSILRDKGIDSQALAYICNHHSPESIVFVDGWTAKGVIARQLAHSIARFNGEYGTAISPDLAVVIDLCGVARFWASDDDYLIPSCLLNATVSGLVSRTLFTTENDFHGCVYYEQFHVQDQSLYFVDSLLACCQQIPCTTQFPPTSKQNRNAFLRAIAQQYGIHSENYIKPGICEATRVLLRRKPRHILLDDCSSPQTQHLRWLAKQKSIPISLIPQGAFRAIALIDEMFT